MAWPGPVPPVMITPWSPNSIGTSIAALAQAAPASGAFPAANRAIFVPFQLDAPFEVYKVWWYNGATASGNTDAGVYDEHGTRLLSAGSTAQSGTNAMQEVDVTNRILGPGRFYLALASSSATATYFRITGTNAVVCKTLGMAQQASAMALPATATLAAVGSAYIPMFGIAARSLAA